MTLMNQLECIDCKKRFNSDAKDAIGLKCPRCGSSEGFRIISNDKKGKREQCKGCKKYYSDSVWLHDKLKICSICWNIHIHSETRMFDGEKWVPRIVMNCEECNTKLKDLKNNCPACPYRISKQYIKYRESRNTLDFFIKKKRKNR